jgi:hypothetical protein
LVAKIRREKYPDKFDINQWRTNLPLDVQKCPDSTLRSVMAYGDDPSQMAILLKMKIDKESSNEDRAATSLDNIIEPLIELQKNSNKRPSLNLFRIILDIDANEIDVSFLLFYNINITFLRYKILITLRFS